MCKNHFQINVKQENEGRFIVKLPFKPSKESIGESKRNAMFRLQSLERKFTKQPKFKQKYSEFIKEYRDLNHMEPISDVELRNIAVNQSFYLPHHGVIKESSLTTKLRVVFDASCKSSSGISLNDALMVGPAIQQDLFSIVTRFRTHQYALSADITKMYRQIWVDPD